MGGAPSIVYSVEVPGQQQSRNSTKIRRHPRDIDGLRAYPSADKPTMKHILQAAFQLNPNRNCFGSIAAGGSIYSQRTVQYLTYREVEQQVIALGSGINACGLAAPIEEVPGQRVRLVGIFSNNCKEWLLVDMASFMYGITSISFYDSSSPDNISFALNNSGLTVMFCSEACCRSLVKITNLGKLKTIVQFGQPSAELILAFKGRKISLISLANVMQKGSAKPLEYVNPKPSQCATFSYTSGTTGQPKAAMISHLNFCSTMAFVQTNPQITLYNSDVYLSYLPLPHILERICVYLMLTSGGTICFYSGDLTRLKEDIELVRPTMFSSVPNLYSKIFDRVKERFRQVKGCQKSMLQSGLKSKLQEVTTTGKYQHWFYDKMVFNKTKETFGGRVRYLGVGGAPISPHIHSFMKGYGLTESTGGCFISDANDPATGHVGGPTSNVEFKLEDIPEMNYTHNDVDEKGRPEPRGEVCIRGPGVFMGYYKNTEATRESVDKDGWFHTGDVGMILPESGALKLIDRKKNIFKLQSGEFVSAKKVEQIYLKRPEVAEIFIHGESTQSFVVAIVVPKMDVIESMAAEMSLKGSFEYLCTHPKIRKQLLSQLNDFATEDGLASFEQPKNIYLEPVSFETRKIRTSTMKLQRHAAKKLYAGQINAMYREGMFIGREK